MHQAKQPQNKIQIVKRNQDKCKRIISYIDLPSVLAVLFTAKLKERVGLMQSMPCTTTIKEQDKNTTICINIFHYLSLYYS